MSIIPKTMSAVLTTGHGGYEVLEYRNDIEVPIPNSDQVLIKVLGAGINNTDINTRTAWYSKSVKGETNANHSQGEDGDGSWSGEPFEFPIIQGADCYGEIVAVGDNVDAGRIGERVLVRTMQQYAVDYRPYECWTMGSECDGAFAQYMVAFSDESFKIESNWSNAELASIPCAYSTAENLLERSGVKQGEIVSVGGDVDAGRIGERVLVRTMQQYAVDYRPYECWTMGSECDGAFAQYMVAFSDESFKIESNWSNAELASIPCAYSTAENLLERSDVKEGEVVLITGASGGVGSAAIMLAKRRGAKVVAVASEAKADMVREIGADEVIHREDKLIDSIDNESIDVVIDLVAGESWGELLEVLKKGGRYAASGAIAGPIVELDVRTLYLKDLVLIGCTFQDRQVFQNLIGYIERNEIKPLVSKTYPLRGIVNAQKDFVSKKYVGKLVLLP